MFISSIDLLMELEKDVFDSFQIDHIGIAIKKFKTEAVEEMLGLLNREESDI